MLLLIFINPLPIANSMLFPANLNTDKYPLLFDELAFTILFFDMSIFPNDMEYDSTYIILYSPHSLFISFNLIFKFLSSISSKLAFIFKIFSSS